jgi:hypothetical protein
MSCGLIQGELEVLRYLVKGRCLSLKHTISIKAIERDMGEKIPDLGKLLDRLVAKGLWAVRKRKMSTTMLKHQLPYGSSPCMAWKPGGAGGGVRDDYFPHAR